MGYSVFSPPRPSPASRPREAARLEGRASAAGAAHRRPPFPNMCKFKSMHDTESSTYRDTGRPPETVFSKSAQVCDACVALGQAPIVLSTHRRPHTRLETPPLASSLYLLSPATPTSSHLDCAWRPHGSRSIPASPQRNASSSCINSNAVIDGLVDAGVELVRLHTLCVQVLPNLFGECLEFIGFLVDEAI